jgi:hypothetical protein
MSDQLKQGYQFSRIGFGVAALVAPGVVGKIFGVEVSGSTALVTRMLGGRDIALGLGQVLGERHNAARGFYEGAALADACDAVAMGIAVSKGDIGRFQAAVGIGLAAGAAVLGILFARTGGGDQDLDAELAELTRTAAAVEDMG